MPRCVYKRSKEHIENIRLAHIGIRSSFYGKHGEKSPVWKGDKVSYKGIHNWIKRHKPEPDICEICDLKKKLDLANISGEYKRDLDDWEYLCRKCHIRKYHSKYQVDHICIICGSKKTSKRTNDTTPRWCRGMCSKCYEIERKTRHLKNA